MISHSCWKHTSLSIGLAKYLERKVLEELENREVYHITKNIGEIELFDFIDELGNDHHKTSLYPEIRRLEPSEYVNQATIEKGFSFFNFLDQGVGMYEIKAALKSLIAQYKNHSLNYSDFAHHYVDYVRQRFEFQHHGFLGQIDWDEWLTDSGYPVFNMHYGNIFIKTLKR